jgi:hypothetical protein
LFIHRLVNRYRDNWKLLREESNRVGAEVEHWPYEKLHRPAEEHPPIERMVAGVSARFQVDCYNVLAGGELAICVDAHGGPSTFLGIKPSYHFFKRRDGSVHYGVSGKTGG